MQRPPRTGKRHIWSGHHSAFLRACAEEVPSQSGCYRLRLDAATFLSLCYSDCESRLLTRPTFCEVLLCRPTTAIADVPVSYNVSTMVSTITVHSHWHYSTWLNCTEAGACVHLCCVKRRLTTYFLSIGLTSTRTPRHQSGVRTVHSWNAWFVVHVALLLLLLLLYIKHVAFNWYIKIQLKS